MTTIERTIVFRRQSDSSDFYNVHKYPVQDNTGRECITNLDVVYYLKAIRVLAYGLVHPPTRLRQQHATVKIKSRRRRRKV